MASSSATLSLCSTFSAHCNVNSRRSSTILCSLSKPSLNLAKPLTGFLSPSTASTSRTAFTVAPKFAESVVEAEPETTDIEAVVVSDVSEVTEEKAKREEIFAVIMVGGRQYIVFPGRYLYTQRLKDANVDDQIVLNKVLLVGTKTHTYIGKPVVTNATVHAVVESQGLNDKVVVFKYKPKKKYRRNIGHRQPNTRIRITGITGYEEYPASPNVAVGEVNL
ncbi:F15O4.7 [Arabidopsis thaliana]|uniref:Large ribosomal subunit protein bL21c n=2 Tax=Arabidopsis TaxID=3701 RepID=RK21_ARATH|nr:Ribosomal protein L21 [Arabidopsis thaliana]P51412.1 RecName: Full=Large ribosomal subunit protein bL21c; AltName: Full=50S ribosomal protein L21, chloroplastic; AltName: Full=CL21; Flags: Precursor [Arabidopsis thaliana]KAG7656463.1 Ribosomal protein L21 [Arabidopsis suecica]AAF79387.1 F15O4.7 [Arabidopsis thaliana]AAL16293.1 At1g35680/F15O4_7 [Arabidopsis thaliana]AAL25535.1 At1g35680/F15O4_7 [Arabidopsis thaliana]AAM51578.1 At1g35680/F15O4_7 [Arabidopsis thaliana]|eukprot:NP_174808.1 Ribosomal protein L21 [Arabidopsis thaliana]